jgi:hypothetical protein
VGLAAWDVAATDVLCVVSNCGQLNRLMGCAPRTTSGAAGMVMWQPTLCLGDPADE